MEQSNEVAIGYTMIPEEQEFKFRGLCPYCKGNLTYRCTGWEQDEKGLWLADQIESECSSEPGIDSEEWEEWLSQHSEMPYVYQLPVDQKVKGYINSKYRFVLE